MDRHYIKAKYKPGTKIWISGAFEHGESAYSGTVKKIVNKFVTKDTAGNKMYADYYILDNGKEVIASHVLANYNSKKEMKKYR